MCYNFLKLMKSMLGGMRGEDPHTFAGVELFDDWGAVEHFGGGSGVLPGAGMADFIGWWRRGFRRSGRF